MTKRCPLCASKMKSTTMSDKEIWQCPMCLYVIEKPLKDQSSSGQTVESPKTEVQESGAQESEA